MSIPPLVCNTPPPPDQCEDDKDTEDFDIPYNLSQDDDENDYEYGGFSTYNAFQLSAPEEIKNQTIQEDKVKSHPIEKLSNDIELEIENNLTEGEEVKHNNVNNHNELYLKVDDSTTIKETVTTETASIEENPIEPTFVHNIDLNFDSIPDSTDLPSNEDIFDEKNYDVNNELKPTITILETETKIDTLDLSVNEDNLEVKVNERIQSGNNEFDDFDNVQCTTSNIPITPIDNCDNPWQNETTEDTEFGTFKANFDEFKPSDSTSAVPSELVIETQRPASNDSDFGDFDDFKSSTVETDTVETSVDDKVFSDLSYKTPCDQEQIVQDINQVLKSIFEDEIVECKDEIETKIETFLCETWGHLIDVDIRQPYIISWNNSLSQKTLLRALCIDSRNILFGSKWNYNVPKYATNLSAAILQPQKASSSLPSSETMTKSNSKPSDTWVDPFKVDGKESCSTETTTPTSAPSQCNLDMFETTQSKGKIYSSTIGLQPIRQINLPDTHIFTPTDSETPRSKTIHYDNPPILLPQASKIDVAFKDTTESNTKDSTIDDHDYSDFQDFKGTTIDFNVPSTDKSIDLSTSKENSTSQPSSFVGSTVIKQDHSDPNITYQTQILQPVKVDPIIPTINWPDPGEIKETFDDFSDFVSNSSWSSNQQMSTSPGMDGSNITNVNTNANTLINNLPYTSKNCSDVDDFDTFQSAVPVEKNKTLPSKNLIITPSTAPSSTKSGTSVPNIPSNEAFVAPVVLTKNYNLDILKSPTSNNISSKQPTNNHNTNSTILSPTPAVVPPSSHQQKSGQILHPLSLESFSQMNLPTSGMDLSKFNPVESLPSLKGESSSNSRNSPYHQKKNHTVNHISDDDIWGDFVSSKPKQPAVAKPVPTFADDDEWTDFVSSPSAKPQNGLNTISFNVHTNNIQKGGPGKLPMSSTQSLDIPALNYVTSKSTHYKHFNDKHFQNL